MSFILSPKFLLILICVFFLVTRFYKISEIPPSVYWDEASIGYNAYAISQDGKDEWGELLPLHFRAFGEFKLPVYIYATAVSVKLFGLNEFSVRLPSIFFGLGVIIATYFLAKKITFSSSVGLLSSFFISISPWFFIFSRTGYEAVAGLLFYILGIYLFLNWSRNKLNILLATASFILAVYSYNSFRIVVPATIFILFVIELKNLISSFKKVLIITSFSLLLFIISLIPIYRLYTLDAGSVRLQTVADLSANSLIKNYLSHLSPNFLLSGDKNIRSQHPNSGQLFPIEILMFIIGFMYILRKTRYSIMLGGLLAIGLLPASITKESPHALRAISVLPFISIISAMGLLFIKKYFKKKYLFEVVLVVISLGFFTNYFLNFINYYPIQSSADWQYGYKKIYTDFSNQFSKYDQILISDEYAQPYIFMLFYQKIDPEQFRKNATRSSIDQWSFSSISQFGKIKFGKVDKLLIDNPQNALIFATNQHQKPNLEEVERIKFLDDSTAFWVYKTKI